MPSAASGDQFTDKYLMRTFTHIHLPAPLLPCLLQGPQKGKFPSHGPPSHPDPNHPQCPLLFPIQVE